MNDNDYDGCVHTIETGRYSGAPPVDDFSPLSGIGAAPPPQQHHPFPYHGSAATGMGHLAHHSGSTQGPNDNIGKSSMISQAPGGSIPTGAGGGRADDKVLFSLLRERNAVYGGSRNHPMVARNGAYREHDRLLHGMSHNQQPLDVPVLREFPHHGPVGIGNQAAAFDACDRQNGMPPQTDSEEDHREAVDDCHEPIGPTPSLTYDGKPPPGKSDSTKVQETNKNGRGPKELPRRPLSAYNLFFSDERERILKEIEAEEPKEKDDYGGPNMVKKGTGKVACQEMAKLIGERWRVLPEEWRKYYQELAEEDMKRHKEAKKRAPKDPSIPRRPPTAFLLFSNKRRKSLKRQYPDATNSDLSKMLSKTWREAPESIRRKYMDEAASMSKSYKSAMAAFRKRTANGSGAGDDGDEDVFAKEEEYNDQREGPSENCDDTYDDIDLNTGTSAGDVGELGSTARLSWSDGTTEKGPSKPLVKKKRKATKRKVKDPNAPKRPLSAFLKFSNSRRKGLKRQYPDATNADLSKMLSKMWHESEKDYRQKFIDEAAELSTVYKEEMAVWRMKGSS